MTEIPKTLPRFLWHYCKRAKYRLFSLVAIVLLWGSTVSLNPYALKLFIDGIGKNQSLTFQLFFSFF